MIDNAIEEVKPTLRWHKYPLEQIVIDVEGKVIWQVWQRIAVNREDEIRRYVCLAKTIVNSEWIKSGDFVTLPEEHLQLTEDTLIDIEIERLMKNAGY